MSFEQLALIIFALGMLTSLYLEHRGLNDMKWLVQKLWNKVNKK